MKTWAVKQLSDSVCYLTIWELFLWDLFDKKNA